MLGKANHKNDAAGKKGHNNTEGSSLDCQRTEIYFKYSPEEDDGGDMMGQQTAASVHTPVSVSRIKLLIQPGPGALLLLLLLRRVTGASAVIS